MEFRRSIILKRSPPRGRPGLTLRESSGWRFVSFRTSLIAPGFPKLTHALITRISISLRFHSEMLTFYHQH